MRAVGRRAAPLNRPRPPAPEPGLPSGPQPGSKPRYEPPSLRTYQYKHGGLLLPGCARSGGRDPARRATPRRLKHAKVPQTLSLSRYVPRPGQNWSNAACCLAAEAAARPQCRGTGLRDTVPTTAERAGGLGGPRARGARAGRPTRARRLDRREPAGLQSRRDSRRRLCCSRRARAAVGGRGRETGGNRERKRRHKGTGGGGGGAGWPSVAARRPRRCPRVPTRILTSDHNSDTERCAGAPKVEK